MLCLAATAGAQVRSASGPAISIARDPLIDAAFERFYNMDYDRATQLFEKYLEKHSTDAFAVNHLLGAYARTLPDRRHECRRIHQ